MKNIDKLLTVCLGALLLASCVENEQPTFNDNDAYVAFDKKSASIDENDATGIVKIPVTLVSLGGLSSDVTLSIDTLSTAVPGENYTIEGDTVLHFTKEENQQYFTIKVIDNDEYTGDRKLIVNIVDGGKVDLGASTKCTITIVDDEHPLAFILNTYSASADSYFSSRGHFDWDITLMKDDDDPNKVWIANLDPYFAKNGYTYANGCNTFYGIVSEDKSSIALPVGQQLGYSGTALVGFSDPDPDAAEEFYETSGNVLISIEEEGAKLTLVNSWGIYEDGFWNLFYGGIELNKK